MPSYKVLQPGFFGGKSYTPRGKRKVLHTDKPFPKIKSGKGKGKEDVPSWLERMDDETAEQKKARLAKEKDQAAADKEKLEQDETEKNIVNFTGDNDGVTNL